MSRYAIVPTAGCYSSGARVHALAVVGDLERARARARSATREYRAAMRPHGGSSGGYRVVATEATTRRDAVWLGWELDLEPTV